MIALSELYEIYRQHPVVCTDTRQLTPGCLFFALKGDNFDGNAFAAQALAGGAAYAVLDDARFQTDVRCLSVSDTLETLQQIAAHHRRQFDIPVIAIGGSNGKTTTKELVAAVLASHYPCHFTKGNLNNHIGVPLTLLAMPDTTEVAVIELGANHPGEIEALCQIAAPTHGLITNIGKEHLEGFGSLAGVKKAEGELYRYLARHDGLVFVNLSEKHLPGMSRRNRKKIVYQRVDALDGPEAGAPLAVQLVAETPFLQLAFLSENDVRVTVNTQLVGRFNFSNLMTAIALGTYFKVPAAKIKAALETYVPANNRSQLIRRDSNTFLLDAYNANPSSMKAALESFRDLPASRKVAILGDMLEVGNDSAREHQAILRLAARGKFDAIVLVGSAFGQCNFDHGKARHFADAAAAKTWLEQQNFQDTLFLLKGSRGIRLEKILEDAKF